MKLIFFTIICLGMKKQALQQKSWKTNLFNLLVQWMGLNTMYWSGISFDCMIGLETSMIRKTAMHIYSKFSSELSCPSACSLGWYHQKLENYILEWLLCYFEDIWNSTGIVETGVTKSVAVPNWWRRRRKREERRRDNKDRGKKLEWYSMLEPSFSKSD